MIHVNSLALIVMVFLTMYCHLATTEPYMGIINWFKVAIVRLIPNLGSYPVGIEVLNDDGTSNWIVNRRDIKSFFSELIMCSCCHSAWLAIPFVYMAIGILAIPVCYFWFIVLKKIF